MFAAIIFVFILNILWIICQAVPLLDLKNALEKNELNTIVTSECSTNGKCSEWLPMQEVQKDIPTIPENLSMSKINIQRQASNLDPNTIIETWDDTSAPLNKFYQTSTFGTKIGNRLSKKDVVMSRSWSAGGMPFSVLYMKSHGSRGNHASTVQQQEQGKIEITTPATMHSNSRIAVRNGSTRRQYSIIPQLFISYGWGPFGK
ncbi:uncharacterized protein LOC102676358 [Apis dorsata]|uniref:uncharacterized protein LOC102676358 n=1 Tax=Apis dorsata TaxID=7462 RepID=UPI0003DF7C9A|nr:uncharacterized protein LOC102676358 [Apis dorsata]